MNNLTEQNSTEDIAIIGMNGRFPGANNIDEFWHNLCTGVESVRFFSDEELLEADPTLPSRFPDILHSPNYIKAGATLDDVGAFDANFFGINPRESQMIDPQQRLFLECAWGALEDAGYNPRRFDGWIGVFAGSGVNEYALNVLTNPEIAQSANGMQVVVANAQDYLATRVSYKLGLKGPSVNVQTACSTSLVAIHMACHNLLEYQCHMALAGGVTVKVPHQRGYFYTEGGTYSADGHCRSFDAKASGTIFSNGVGVVVLKRLADAVADGDHIYAVIKGSAVNNDGDDKIGFTAPSRSGQAEVISMALAVADIDPATITYVEAHGTATPLGDPIEIAGLTKAFRAETDKKQYCAIGSVKTNIGHTEGAAGVAGVIKTALALKHNLLPPSLNFESPNPQIDFANSPFYVNTQLKPWTANGSPRRAGVSSFGIGGTNAHAILEEAPELPATSDSRPWKLLLLSAKTETALTQKVSDLAAYLKTHPDLPLADVAYTLQVGRERFDYCFTAVCQETADVVQKLEAFREQPRFVHHKNTNPPSIAFLFPGQGSQYINMALGLYQAEPVFTQEVDRCARMLQTSLGLDLRHILYPSETAVSQATDQLKQTWITQPALFVVEYALAKLWMSWGIQPQAMIGHSIGEYVAACLAGVFSLEDALALVAARGRLMQGLPKGAMLAVSLPEHEILPLLNHQLSLAAINSPSLCVVSGTNEAVTHLANHLNQQGVHCRHLQTSHAFHSAMMEPVVDPFLIRVKQVKLNTPRIPFISNVTGTWITAEQAMDPTYWAKHLRQPVRFNDGIAELLKTPDYICVEVGPGQTLQTFVKPYQEKLRDNLNTVRHPNDETDDLAYLLKAMGRLWACGAEISWKGYYEGEVRRRVSLPGYPFERQRYWLERQEEAAGKKNGRSSTSRQPLSDWFYLPSWKRTLPPVAESSILQNNQWLLFADEQGVAHHLANRLHHHGIQPIMVQAGQQFTQLDSHTFTLNPQETSHYTHLLDALPASPTAILHLWNVGQTDIAPQTASFDSLLLLAQALGKQKSTPATTLTILSNNLYSTSPTDIPHSPHRALLLGPAKVIPQEYPHLHCRSIDFSLPNSFSATFLDHLLAEAVTATSEQVVAYRGRERLVQTFEPAPLPEQLQQPRLRHQGVYLITGGLGGIGLVLAGYLAKTCQARLVLLGRSGLPPRQTWGEWLSNHPDSDRVSQQIRQVQELEAAGAEVLVLAADVTNNMQMETAVSQTLATFGSLHGVIHAAGLPGGGLIQLKTLQAATQVLAPKVQGTQILAQVLHSVSLDFLCLCSSVIGITGGVGQVDYCAANAFMDVFAEAHTQQTGTFTLSINWDGWQEVGMLANTQTARTPQTTAVSSTNGHTPLQPSPAPKPVALPHLSTPSATLHPLLNEMVVENENSTRFVIHLQTGKQWLLAEHHIMGQPAPPGTSYLEMVRAAFTHLTGQQAVELREVIFSSPILMDDSGSRTVHLQLDKEPTGYTFRLLTQPTPTTWQEHARGQVGAFHPASLPPHAIQAAIDRCPTAFDVTTPLNQDGSFVYWGPRWQCLRRVYLGENEAVAYLSLPEAFATDLETLALHPALLDVATAVSSQFSPGERFLPLGYEQLRFYAPLPATFYSHLVLHSNRQQVLRADVTLVDEQGQVLVEIKGFALRRVDDQASSRLQTPPAQPTSAKPAIGYATAIRPAEGIEAFRRVLARCTVSQIAIVTTDLPTRIEQTATSRLPDLLSQASQTPSRTSSTAYARPDLHTPYASPRNDTEQALVLIWQDLLGLNSVGIHDSFFELGGHSLLGLAMTTRIRETLQFELPLSALFQQPTIADLAAAIDGHQTTQTEEKTPLLSEFVIVPDPLHRHEPFPLTDVQQAYWVGRSGQFALGNVSTHGYSEVDTTDLDLNRLTQAWRLLIDRHDMLRAIILPDGRQQILPTVPPYQIKTVDLRGRTEEEKTAEIEAIRAAMSHQVLPADQWPLFEVRATILNDRQIRIHLSIDLLIGDLWSLRLLAGELNRLYEDPSTPLPHLELSFRDHVLAEIALRNTPIYQRALNYWRGRLATLPPAPDLPLAKNPQAITTPRFVRYHARLETAVWQRLKERATQVGLTPSGVLMAAYAEVLATWSKRRRFTLNLTLFNRLPLHPQVNDIAGDFTSLTLLEVDFSLQDTFVQRARRLQQRLWDDLDHRYVSGVQVLRELRRTQAESATLMGMPVVFTSTLGFDLDSGRKNGSEESEGAGYSISQTPQVWIDQQVGEAGGELVYNWDVVEELFPAGMIGEMFAAYQGLLERLVQEETAWQQAVLVGLPEGQQEQRLAVNTTQKPVPSGLLHSLFLQQAAKQPDALAVVSPSCRLSYAQLYQQANQVAHWLHERGASPNQLVGVVMEKGWEQVVAVLGILQAGAAYLPIDAGLPQERIHYLLENGQVQLALTQSWVAEGLTWPSGVRWVSVDGDGLRGMSREGLEVSQTAENLAYVIFTSGSTGQPKGVMIDHRGALNTVVDLNERFAITSQDRVLGLSALNFDLSVYDIFGVLGAGGAVVLPRASDGRDPAEWLKLVEGEQVTVWNTVPALMKMLVEYAKGQGIGLPNSLRLVMMSGDWIPVDLPGQIQGLLPQAEIFSLGGATEASIWSILYPIQKVPPEWVSIPYGKPMWNQTFHVLDGGLQPRPTWVPGELYIGGIGLAKGYWRDEAKTAARFITHPSTGERLYRTGDLGRYLPDGNIEFLGREDFQVKVQGYRIELGEVEAALLQHPAVQAAVVTAVGENQREKRLVAYLVGQQLQETAVSNGHSSPTPHTLPDFSQESGTLSGLQRLEFKLQHHGIRQEAHRPRVALKKPVVSDELRQLYQARRSERVFSSQPIPFAQFSQFLSCLMALKEGWQAKYRYPSAGSLYPVQTYLHIRPQAVEGVTAGVYYYHPEEGNLVLLSENVAMGREVHAAVNQEIFDQAGFSLFLVGKLGAIEPLYGQWARDFCLLEAGYMSQLLMMEAPQADIGLCPIGSLNFETIRPFFHLQDDHILLHTLLGGRSQEAPLLELPPLAATQIPQLTNGLTQETATETMREFLKEKLPSYMIPSAFILMEALPLTTNGKVDRQALPAPQEHRADTTPTHTLPQTDLEQAIAAILQQVLQLETVGLHDNFFDLGGTSVHIVQAHARLCGVIGKNISITELFTHPTIYSLAEFLGQEQPKEATEFKKIQERSQKQRQVTNPQQERLKRMRRGNE